MGGRFWNASCCGSLVKRADSLVHFAKCKWAHAPTADYLSFVGETFRFSFSFCFSFFKLFWRMLTESILASQNMLVWFFGNYGKRLGSTSDSEDTRITFQRVLSAQLRLSKIFQAAPGCVQSFFISWLY